MRRWIAKAATWVGVGIAGAWLLARSVLDLVGYSTSPEDAEGIPAKAIAVLNWIDSQPWLVAYGVPALLIGFGFLTLWSQDGTAERSHASKRVPVSALREQAMKLGWTLNDRSAASSNDSYELAKRLRQSVIDGEQPLWGRLRIMPGTGTSALVHEPH